MAELTSVASAVFLRNGIEIPCIGFDARDIPASECEKAVRDALEAGYRYIATASFYDNEAEVGKAVSTCGLDRGDVFLASRASDAVEGYDATMAALKASIEKLGVDYLDLYLVSMPKVKKADEPLSETARATWKALEDAYAQGLVRAIGVSGLTEEQLQPLMEVADVLPMVDQIELHPRCNQPTTRNYCRHHGIVAEAWMPLGDGTILNDTTIIRIADELGVTPAQVCLRWCLQRGALPLPTTTDPIEMAIDADVFRFSIGPEDLALIDFMDAYGMSAIAPKTKDD